MVGRQMEIRSGGFFIIPFPNLEDLLITREWFQGNICLLFMATSSDIFYHVIAIHLIAHDINNFIENNKHDGNKEKF